MNWQMHPGTCREAARGLQADLHVSDLESNVSYGRRNIVLPHLLEPPVE